MLDIPFYANTPDDTHCFQAALKMVLKYFLPQQEFNFEQLDKMTAKVEGKWTWQMAGLLWMKKNGFDVLDFENFNYTEFINRGGDFLLEEYGEDIGRIMIDNSIISQEFEYAKQLLQEISIQTGKISIQDIERVLQKKYVPICLINAQALNGKKGYVGHFVVVKGIENNNLILQDPGLPPIENRKVSFEDFGKAWAYPTEKEKNIIAFKLSNI